MIQFNCPNCNNVIRVRNEAAGKKGECLGCGETLHIPQTAALKPKENRHPQLPDNQKRSATPVSESAGMLPDMLPTHAITPSIMFEKPKSILQSVPTSVTLLVIGIATWIGFATYASMQDELRLAQTGADRALQKYDRMSKARIHAIMGVPDDVVSKDNYDRIRDGMSYSEVVGIIGSRGTELSSSRLERIEGVMPSLTTKMYSWQNPNATNMTAMFQNNRLVSKAQFGLR